MAFQGPSDVMPYHESRLLRAEFRYLSIRCIDLACKFESESLEPWEVTHAIKLLRLYADRLELVAIEAAGKFPVDNSDTSDVVQEPIA